MTVSAIMENLPEDGHLDIIEINPQMPKAQGYFRPYLKFGLEDARVALNIEDGFKHFATLSPQAPRYDAIVMDVAWMQNMNATHLFSQEMFRNIDNALKEDGVLGVWSEEANPYSPTSLIIYKTLKSVFTYVVPNWHDGVTLFFASQKYDRLARAVPQPNPASSEWMDELSSDMPINRLDDLAMNRTKFTAFGDSTWERLQEKYKGMKTAPEP